MRYKCCQQQQHGLGMPWQGDLGGMQTLTLSMPRLAVCLAAAQVLGMHCMLDMRRARVYVCM